MENNKTNENSSADTSISTPKASVANGDAIKKALGAILMAFSSFRGAVGSINGLLGKIYDNYIPLALRYYDTARGAIREKLGKPGLYAKFSDVVFVLAAYTILMNGGVFISKMVSGMSTANEVAATEVAMNQQNSSGDPKQATKHTEESSPFNQLVFNLLPLAIVAGFESIKYAKRSLDKLEKKMVTQKSKK